MNIIKLIKKRLFWHPLNSLGFGRIITPIDPFFVQRALIDIKEPVIFDVGAHTGEVTIQYRELYPLASIHCFEPFPKAFQDLQKKFERDERVFCHQTAITEQ